MALSERKRWERLGGSSLENLLKSGAISLLDAGWLVESTHDLNVIRCRQQLPNCAFLRLDQIIEASQEDPIDRGLHILVLSYMWLHPIHPDPKADTLRLVRRVLPSFIERSKRKFSKKLRWGLFWDYASLFQHPDPQAGHFRTPSEEALFREGLEGLSNLFTHTNTTILKVTQHPPNYPRGYNLPENSNVAAYIHRGWPFTESCWASMTKDSSKTLDISPVTLQTEPLPYVSLTQMTVAGQRGPPLTPERFDHAIQDCCFTNGKEDQRLVMRLYRNSFIQTFHSIQSLDYSGLGWDDTDVTRFCEILRGGCAPQVKSLSLKSNRIGVHGCRSVVAALEAVPSVTKLELGGNPRIGDQGCTSLAKVSHGLVHLDLDGTGLTNAGLTIMLQQLNKEKLQVLCLRFNDIDESGYKDLELFVRDCQSLSCCDVYGNPISLENRDILDRLLSNSFMQE